MIPINKITSQRGEREPVMSFEPTIRAYDKADSRQLIGRLPTRDEHTQMLLQLQVLVFGESTWAEWANRFEPEDYNTTKVNRLRDAMVAWIDKWDALLQSGPRQVQAFQLANPSAKNNYVRWINLPEYQDVNAAIDAVFAVLRKYDTALLKNAEDWVDVAKALRLARTVATTTLATIGGFNAGKLFSGFGFGSASVHASPSSMTAPFVNAETSRVIDQMYQASGVQRTKLDAISKLANSKAKQYRKVIMNNRASRKSAVASFGNTEISLHAAPARNRLLDAAVEAVLKDHLALESAVHCTPGSMDAYMIGDMCDAPIMRDAQMHRDMRAHFLCPDDEEWYYETDYVPLEEEEPGYYSSDYDEQSPYAYTEAELCTFPLPPASYTTEYNDYPVSEDTKSSFDFGDILNFGKGALDLYRTVKQIQSGGVTAPPQQRTVGAPATISAIDYGDPTGLFTWKAGRVIAIPMPVISEYRARATAIIKAYLADPNMVPRTATDHPFYTASPPFPKNTIVRFADRAVGIGSTRKKVKVPYLSKSPAYLSARKPLEDANCGSLFDRTGTAVPAGQFFKSGLITAELKDLPAKTYGQIDVGQLPYKIEINRNYVDSRAKVSFVHETLHAITELLKLGLSHQELHALSVFITSEVLPGYLALEKKLSQSQ